MYDLAALIVGIALLVGGLFTMRFGLMNIFSHSFRHILTQLTLTPLRGLVIGTIAAAVMQSSTALTLITVGLVSAEYLTFYAGLGIILGANIGTCSTVQLLTISPPIEYLLPALLLSALLAVSAKYRTYALAALGLFAMFTGLSLVTTTMGKLAEISTVVKYLADTSHSPVYGIGGGILLTFLFQSSSAATGLLMVLTQEGIIDLTGAAYGVYGNNIGSCLPSLIAGLAAPLSAKRVALSHIVLNLLGVMLFFPFSNLLIKIATLLSGDLAGQVAMIHTLFNVISSLAVLPFVKPFAKLITILVP
ncbi:MAG: Na+/Picotransporter [Firmicutes bacterium]|nr:Na+/Picotransporter [Bacillota bacterium]